MVGLERFLVLAVLAGSFGCQGKAVPGPIEHTATETKSDEAAPPADQAPQNQGQSDRPGSRNDMWDGTMGSPALYGGLIPAYPEDYWLSDAVLQSVTAEELSPEELQSLREQLIEARELQDQREKEELQRARAENAVLIEDRLRRMNEPIGEKK